MVRFETELTVRYYETDQMGVVHHSNYIRYFECGRIEMLKAFGLPVERIEKEGVMMPIVSVDCHYRLPSTMGEVLRIVCTIKKLPVTRLVIDTDVLNADGVRIAYGVVTLGFIDTLTRRPSRCPASLTKVILEHNVGEIG